jgi:ABC-type Na+ transport system ATPase subunit NatA
MVAKAAAPNSVKIDNSGFYAKRKVAREVVTGRGDLVPDAANTGLDVSTISENELPEYLKIIPAQQRKQWLVEKMQALKGLEDRMALLIAKRDAYVLEQRKNKLASMKSDSFDSVVKETLKSQLN